MAKKKQTSANERYAVNKKYEKLARERAAQEQAALEKRRNNREKSRNLGNAFLFAVLALIGLFSLYTLIRLLFFRASSVSELRDDLLFVSLVSIPYLLGMGAVLVRRLNRKRREGWSDRGRRLSGFVFALVLLAAFVLFGWQFLKGRTDASARPAYTQTVAALERSGLSVTLPEEPYGVNTLLEYSLQTDLRCGETAVRLNCHADSLGWTAKGFRKQLARDYASCTRTERGGAELWGPEETNGTARAAVAIRSEREIRIVELSGPLSELETLLPLLAASAE